MAKKRKIADRLDYQTLSKIQDYLIEMVETSITPSDVWSDIGKVLTSGITKKQFIDSLSVNIELHRLSGFKIKDDMIVLESEETAQKGLKSLQEHDSNGAVDDIEFKWNSKNHPMTTLTKTKKLWIKDSCYLVPMAPSTMVYLLERVFLAKRSESGKILFEGKKYDCDTDLLHRYLFFFLGISPNIEEPNENMCDENGIPLCLI